MNNHLLKTGSISLVLGPEYYRSYVKEKKNKLLKITKIIEAHNEFKNLDIIRQIENYSDYYSIPDEVSFILTPNNNFYSYIKSLFPEICEGPLSYFYVDDAGNQELLTTINNIHDCNDFSIWKSYSKILSFAINIMTGITFLHDKQICHLDIKPENIMVNTITRSFKIIDFGFCSKEPFDDYVSNIRGTPGYFPKYYTSVKIKPWFPRIEANDLTLVNNEIPMIKNRQLVYKVDSYCFGRILYLLNYVYTDNSTHCCYFFNKQSKNKINNLIDSLMEDDVFKRLTIKQALAMCYTF